MNADLFPLDLLRLLPSWAAMTLYGLLLSFQIVAGAFLLARIGRTPLWALLLLLPVPIAPWFFALCRWPRGKA